MEKPTVLVVGAGHAGCEAALSLSRRGIKVLLLTLNSESIAQLPCNPSIGGPAKGIIVRELDLLGGVMGKIADQSQLQTKMLNTAKGLAVRSLRSQVDKLLYQQLMRQELAKEKKIEIIYETVERLLVEKGQIQGVTTHQGNTYKSHYVLLSTGTYLNSRCLIGQEITISGPDGGPTSTGLSQQLRELGYEVIRLKTGTPPRLNSATLNYAKMEREDGDHLGDCFSHFQNTENSLPEVPCYLTRTTEQVHQTIRENLGKSATYGGIVEGVGPRYCPSIEDKVVRFKDKNSHLLFVEPESLELETKYLGGFSTSMPRDVQLTMVHQIPGLEEAEIKKYAYAIEYDAVNPLEIYPTLETKKTKGLFFAGQINGTSGYEEAAGQVIVAGINIGNQILGLPPFVLGRDEAYIGVLIDDLTTKGTKEPYRMLTSRSEYRLLLRHDNADERLGKYAREWGLLAKEDLLVLEQHEQEMNQVLKYCGETILRSTPELEEYLFKLGTAPLKQREVLGELLKRPEFSAENTKDYFFADFSELAVAKAMVHLKYDGYIEKAYKIAEQQKKYDNYLIPKELDYQSVPNLSHEAIDKLSKIRPLTIGQANRILGINPVDIYMMVCFLYHK
jgi:tRNA uridine 5-carboxymethylaminomethyl modification enzyme